MKKQLLKRFEELILENDEQRALIGSFREDEKIWADREQEAHDLAETIRTKDAEIEDLKARLACTQPAAVEATEAADIQRLAEAIGTVIELNEYLPGDAQDGLNDFMQDIHSETDWISNGKAATQALPAMLALSKTADEKRRGQAPMAATA